MTTKQKIRMIIVNNYMGSRTSLDKQVENVFKVISEDLTPRIVRECKLNPAQENILREILK